MIKPFSLSIFGIDNQFDYFKKKVCIFIEGLGIETDSWFNRKEYVESEYKVLINCTEPLELTRPFFTQQDIIDNHSRFDLILTSHVEILHKCKNSVLFPFGSGWISPIQDDYEKRDTLSFLCGTKQYLPGHILRHTILQHQCEIQSPLTKEFYYTYSGKKDEILYPSLFSIIVENTQYTNYFTEKIIDCMLAKTIPIYWGCPNISDYFNTRGIIKFNDINELAEKTNMLTRDVYISRLNIVEDNFTRALEYKDFHKRVSNEIAKRI